jgi:uncharacterized membrane protein
MTGPEQRDAVPQAGPEAPSGAAPDDAARASAVSGTAAPENAISDEDPRVRRAELLISAVLRIGVLTSLAIILLGTVLTFLHHPSYLSSRAELARLTQPGAAVPHTLGEVLEGVRARRGQAIIALGLLLLILTPVVRVAVSIFAFVAQRDWPYVLITSCVLVLLILSMVLGLAGG